MIRNFLVYEESIRILNKVYNLAREDVEEKRDFHWRYNEYEKVSYNKMLFQFWKPIKSFYKNNPCLKTNN